MKFFFSINNFKSRKNVMKFLFSISNFKRKKVTFLRVLLSVLKLWDGIYSGWSFSGLLTDGAPQKGPRP